MTKVYSQNKWNDTGFTLVKGRKYHYAASGIWKDFWIKCDANGFSNLIMDFASGLKRTPSAQWFQLIGVIDQNPQHTIELGTDGNFVAPESGQLWAYANDAPFAYGNNSGSIELSVREVT